MPKTAPESPPISAPAPAPDPAPAPAPGAPESNPEALAQAIAGALLLDNQLCFALYQASNRMTRGYRPLLEPLGVTYSQYIVLLVLWEQSPLSVGDLGHRLDLDSGTLTPLLKRMEQAGLVERQRAVNDERRVMITLTPAGRALKDKAQSIPFSVFTKTALSADALADLRARLKVLSAALGE